MKITLDIKLTEQWKEGEDRELLCGLCELPGLRGALPALTPASRPGWGHRGDWRPQPDSPDPRPGHLEFRELSRRPARLWNNSGTCRAR